MSQENVAVVRRVFDAEAGRDSAALDALYDPDVEMNYSNSPFADFAESVVRGIGEVRRTFRDFYAAFGDVQADVKELIDADEEHVISVFTYRGTGRGSGVETEFRDMAGVWTIRNGKIVRVTWLRTREEALEAVGLRE